MKAFTIVAKILVALAAVAGAVYLAATYGEKIVAWAKKMLKCNEEVCEVTEEDLEVPAEEVVEEEAPAAEEEAPAEEAPAAEEEVVANEADFEG